MNSYPSQLVSCSPASSERERIRSQLESLIETLGGDAPQQSVSSSNRDAALATALMDTYRRFRDAEVFEGLVLWAGPQLKVRVRSRLRSLGAILDPNEVWQDTIVNIYRYPDRFLASRPGAFAAWSSVIVDNAIRRLLRRSKRDLAVTLRDPESLQEQVDTSIREPSAEAENNESCRVTASAFRVVLEAYLHVFQHLSQREQFVLQMVEVRDMRYAELAKIIGIRPEALKMVVFRARKRIHQLLEMLLTNGEMAARACKQRSRIASATLKSAAEAAAVA